MPRKLLMGCPASKSDFATGAQSYLENSTTCKKSMPKIS